MLATRPFPLSTGFLLAIALLLPTAHCDPTPLSAPLSASTAATTIVDRYHLFGTTTYIAYIARATISIIQDVYVPVSSSLAVTLATALSSSTSYQQSGFINDVLHSISPDIVQTVETAAGIGPYQQRFFNVLFVDSYEAFRLIYERMTESCFDYTGLYTVVLTESSRYQYETITRILEDCWALYITNVIVLVSIHPQARTAVYTYFPYTRFHCEAVAPVIVNYYLADGFLYDRVPFFPNKVNRMFGCPLRLAAYELIPYMMLERRDDGNYYMDGIDGIVSRVLSQRLNFTPVVVVPSDGTKWGTIFANGSGGTGSFGMIMRGEANMTIGAIACTYSRKLVMSPSFPYYQSALYFAVPGGRNYTAFEKLFLPFRRHVWLNTLALFAATAVLFGVLRCTGRQRLDFVVGVGNRTPFVNMMAVFLGAGFLDAAMPTRNFARYVLMVWMLACMVLRTAYQGALFQLLQSQMRAPAIDRLDDLIAANYSLRMENTLFGLFDGIPKAKPFLRTTDTENNMQGFDNLTLRPTYRDVYLTTELFVGFYNKQHMNHTVLLSHEKLFNLQFSIYFRKHSCLTAAMNTQIHLYQVSGLLNKWLTNFYDNAALRIGGDAKEQRGVHRPLYVGQVSGVFQICAYMLALSLVVLGLELLAQRSQHLRRLFDGI